MPTRRLAALDLGQERNGVVDRAELLARIHTLPVDARSREHIEALLARLSG